MTKRPLIWAFLPLFLGVFWVALGSAPAGASVIYSTDFENFEISALDGQNGWSVYHSSRRDYWQIQTSISKSGIKAVKYEAPAYWNELYSPTFSSTDTGYLEFWYMTTAANSTGIEIGGGSRAGI